MICNYKVIVYGSERSQELLGHVISTLSFTSVSWHTTRPVAVVGTAGAAHWELHLLNQCFPKFFSSGPSYGVQYPPRPQHTHTPIQVQPPVAPRMELTPVLWGKVPRQESWTRWGSYGFCSAGPAERSPEELMRDTDPKSISERWEWTCRSLSSFVAAQTWCQMVIACSKHPEGLEIPACSRSSRGFTRLWATTLNVLPPCLEGGRGQITDSEEGGWMQNH